MMVDHLRRGEVQSAQTLLDATGCTCPSGELWRTIYDESGIKYTTRNDLWIVFEPMGLVAEEEEVERSEGEGEAERAAGEDEEQDKELESAEASSEKGKGKALETFKVKCRLSSTGQDLIIEMHSGEKVGSLIKKLTDAAKVGVGSTAHIRMIMFANSKKQLKDKRIRITYLGHIYHDNDTLATFQPGHVLSAFIFDDK